uniref:Ig-like domain-containing protein n=1 Tax=Pseudonaja textilis TaxID=8673 RepID=A0A670ZCB2_PSETE
MSYFYLHLPDPSRGPPQFSIWSYLDDQPIARFDSLTRRMEPLVPWMEEVGDPWDSGEGNPRPLSFTSTPPGSPSGPHTWQAVLGCELREDRSTGGFFHYGYDGRDFISFDKETLTWVAAQPKAWKFKKEWEEDPGWSERNKFFLEETCIEWLQRYLSYKNRTQETTGEWQTGGEAILTCQAFGFYPKEIQATWRRDGEIWEQETLLRNMAPNSDGTYYLWLSIEIDPKERDRFRCHLEHEGLQECLIVAPPSSLQGHSLLPLQPWRGRASFRWGHFLEAKEGRERLPLFKPSFSFCISMVADSCGNCSRLTPSSCDSLPDM